MASADMLTPPKPLAAHASSLLARKGAARPAMRPRDASGSEPVDGADDLGWNDMGVDAVPASHPIPSVLVEREALKSGIERQARIGPGAAPKAKGAKAAFTLRLDADRHLRPRLASAVTKCSSQQLLIQALDAFLQRLPEVEAAAAQLPQRKPRKR